MKKRIIVALDTDSPEAALETASSLSGEVGLFKVGMELFPRGGPELVRRIRNAGTEVFLDLKFHDIPNTVERAAAAHARRGVEIMNAHGCGGVDMLRAFAAGATEGARAAGVAVPTTLAVTVLTNFDGNDLRDMGIQWTVQDLVTARALLASEVGCDGVIASGEEAAALRPDELRREPRHRDPAERPGLPRDRIPSLRSGQPDCLVHAARACALQIGEVHGVLPGRPQRGAAECAEIRLQLAVDVPPG